MNSFKKTINMSKTLLFAPLFIDNQERYIRNIQWLNYVISIKQHLNFNEIYYVDNVSDPNLYEKFNDNIPTTYPFFPITISEHKVRLERRSHLMYPYWYYAFGNALKYAIDNNFDKVLHLDTDFYLLNSNICDYINNIDKGWNTFWCSKHNFPEATFQLICQDKLEEAHEFYTRDFLAFYPDKPAETEIPFTNIIKEFKGDRFGEDNLEQTLDVDWYAQKPNNIKLKFNE